MVKSVFFLLDIVRKLDLSTLRDSLLRAMTKHSRVLDSQLTQGPWRCYEKKNILVSSAKR